MKLCYLILTFLAIQGVRGQSLGKIPDSVRTKLEAERRGSVTETEVQQPSDDVIKAKLVKLALKNPAIAVADANINIAEANQQKAKSGWLSYIAAGANVNEFVINGSAAASFFPKYNVGVTIPFDIVARQKLARKTADETFIINDALKQQQVNAIKAEVLTRYETYKEKKQLVELQKIAMDADLTAYEAAQQDYADGEITLIEMNKAYQSYTIEKGKLVSAERNLNVSIIQLEEIIGVPLSTVLP